MLGLVKARSSISAVRRCAWSRRLDGHVRFSTALQRRGARAAAGAWWATRMSPSCNTPAARPGGQGACSLPPQHHRQPAAGARMDFPRGARAGIIITARRCTTSSRSPRTASPSWKTARQERADPRPARHPGLHQGARPAPLHRDHRVNTLFNALLNNPEFAKLDFSRCG